jgi:hypothetical protein
VKVDTGQRERSQFPRGVSGLLTLVVMGILLAAIPLLARASASGAGADCKDGAISAIGPLDAQGRGQTTPEARCIERPR